MAGETVSKTGNEDDVSLTWLIQQWRASLRYLRTRWKLILSLSLLGAGLGLAYGFLVTKRYVAELTFVVDDSKASSLSSYAGLASAFGIDLGSATSTGIFSGDNIMAFLESKLMVTDALLSDTIFDGRRVTLGDIFLESIGWKDQWSHKPRLKDFSFPLGATRATLTRLQDSVIDLIYTRITKKDMVISKPDRKLSFINVEVSSYNEVFSKLFTERLMQAAGDFYIKTKTYRSEINVSNLQTQADSILQMLNKTTYVEARTQDLNLNPVKHVGLIDAEALTRDKTILVTAYSEVIRNLGMAKMALAQETPVIEVVDDPLYPLKVDKTHKAIDVVVGFIAAGFLTMMFLLSRRFYKHYAPKDDYEPGE